MKKIIIFISIFFLFSCASSPVTGIFNSSGMSYEHKSRTPDEIEIYLEGEPYPSNIKAVGIVRTDWEWKGLVPEHDNVMKALRETAAINGLDGIYNVRFVPLGAGGQGLGEGTGFIYVNQR